MAYGGGEHIVVNGVTLEVEGVRGGGGGLREGVDANLGVACKRSRRARRCPLSLIVFTSILRSVFAC